SRRGDFRHIVRETRWELDAAGHGDVDVFVSGGITPSTIRELRDVADGFGVGSHVTDADPVDFALDIVEVGGEPAAKRGKLSGRKSVSRTPDGGHHVALADAEGPTEGDALMHPVVRDGDVVADVDLEAAADHARAEARAVGFRDHPDRTA
ncbi:nicotinate phosphoribosyltransferase, partial [Halobacteriales archaeon SW_12_69_24]